MTMAHEVKGTTYYACGECGACGCGHVVGHDRWGHQPGCSHELPPWWDGEDCAVMGAKRFTVCSRCAQPPCRYRVDGALLSDDEK